jgi:hypothetical protein
MSRGKKHRVGSALKKRQRRAQQIVLGFMMSEPMVDAMARYIYEQARAIVDGGPPVPPSVAVLDLLVDEEGPFQS